HRAHDPLTTAVRAFVLHLGPFSLYACPSQEDSPSPVYGAALLMRLGLTPFRGSNPRSSALRSRAPTLSGPGSSCCPDRPASPGRTRPGAWPPSRRGGPAPDVRGGPGQAAAVSRRAGAARPRPPRRRPPDRGARLRIRNSAVRRPRNAGETSVPEAAGPGGLPFANGRRLRISIRPPPARDFLSGR